MSSHNTSSWIAAAKKVHGDTYNYALSKYKGSQEKVSIVCRKHGVFEQQAASHLSGRGCPLCASQRQGKERSLGNEAFLAKAKEIHGDRYGYSKVEYVNRRRRVIITCPVHGDFLQYPKNHLRGSGCDKCAREARIGVGMGKALSNESRYVNRRVHAVINRLYNGRVDKGGNPYIEHLEHVAKESGCLRVGLCHDVVEDGLATYDDLFAWGLTEDEVLAVGALTNTKSKDYFSYIRDIILHVQTSKDLTALKVKMADLKHNMDISRLPVEKISLSLLVRYKKSYDMLKAALGELNGSE